MHRVQRGRAVANPTPGRLEIDPSSMVSVKRQTSGARVGMECYGGCEQRWDLAVGPSATGSGGIGVFELVIFVGGIVVGSEVGQGVFVEEFAAR